MTAVNDRHVVMLARSTYSVREGRLIASDAIGSYGIRWIATDELNLLSEVVAGYVQRLRRFGSPASAAGNVSRYTIYGGTRDEIKITVMTKGGPFEERWTRQRSSVLELCNHACK